MPRPWGRCYYIWPVAPPNPSSVGYTSAVVDHSVLHDEGPWTAGDRRGCSTHPDGSVKVRKVILAEVAERARKGPGPGCRVGGCCGRCRVERPPNVPWTCAPCGATGIASSSSTPLDHGEPPLELLRGEPEQPSPGRVPFCWVQLRPFCHLLVLVLLLLLLMPICHPTPIATCRLEPRPGPRRVGIVHERDRIIAVLDADGGAHGRNYA